MNSIRHRTNKLIAAIGLLVMCSSLLVACGGSSGGGSSDTVAGIGGTGIVSGKITGFGSVHVNGGKFEIDTSRFDVDGDTGANQDDLALGMVVQLRVETENGVFTNKAIEVVYDDEVEGPVTSVMTPDPMNPAIKTGIVKIDKPDFFTIVNKVSGKQIVVAKHDIDFADLFFEAIGDFI